MTGDQYRMILECAKDSVATSYGNNIDEFAGTPHTANRSELQLEETDGPQGSF